MQLYYSIVYIQSSFTVAVEHHTHRTETPGCLCLCIRPRHVISHAANYTVRWAEFSSTGSCVFHTANRDCRSILFEHGLSTISVPCECLRTNRLSSLNGVKLPYKPIVAIKPVRLSTHCKKQTHDWGSEICPMSAPIHTCTQQRKDTNSCAR